jgi:hypothetical protein
MAGHSCGGLREPPLPWERSRRAKESGLVGPASGQFKQQFPGVGPASGKGDSAVSMPPRFDGPVQPAAPIPISPAQAPAADALPAQAEPLWSIPAPALPQISLQPVESIFNLPRPARPPQYTEQVPSQARLAIPSLGVILRNAAPLCVKGAAAAAIVLIIVYWTAGRGSAEPVLMPWDRARRSLQDRAAQRFEERFDSDLKRWQSDADMIRSWSYSAAGYARPAKAAFFRPTFSMSDYRLDFDALIERKGIGWIFRAAGPRDYYASKIVLLQSDPPYLATTIHYAVIGGVEGPRVQSPATFYAAPGIRYHVRFDAAGGRFITSLQGHIVDAWEDRRLKTGGVGFFSDEGERARLFGVRVSHNDDFLGRLCALLAPGASDPSAKR